MTDSRQTGTPVRGAETHGHRRLRWRNSSEHWGAVAIALHWLAAVLILGLMVLGWVATSWHLSPTKLNLFVWHKSFGLVALALVLVRIVWRVLNPPPVFPGSMPLWERRLARGVHIALYLIMLFMPLSGWVINSAANFPLKLFWVLPVPDLVAPGKAVQQAAQTVHLALFWALALLLSLHVGAALKHHFRNHDDILRNMLPILGNGRKKR